MDQTIISELQPHIVIVEEAAEVLEVGCLYVCTTCMCVLPVCVLPVCVYYLYVCAACMCVLPLYVLCCFACLCMCAL